MTWVLGLGVYSLGVLGYNATVRRLGVSPYLSWITVFLVQIILLYGFAMVGWLTPGIWVITLVGVALLLYWWLLGFWGKGALPFEGLHLFDGWMVGLGLVMVQVLGHSPLVHYDNFSHWAVMVKFLTFTGHLPGAHDTIISFTSYPPATALFITQFVHWVGFSEGAMLIAQFLLIWAASYSVFAVLRDRTRALTSFLLCLTIAVSYVFNINIRLNNLLVDYVLPILTVAGLVGVYVYRQKPGLQCGHVALVGAVLLLVKNSATFFVVVLASYFLGMLWTTRPRLVQRWPRRWASVWGRFTGTLVVLALPFLWWEWHVTHTFTVSKHEISAAAYRQQLQHEGNGTVLKLGHQFLKQVVNGQSLSTQGILLINGLLLGCYILIRWRSHQKNPLLKTLVAVDVIFGLYYASLFGMYVLSMPYAEAIRLDGFERYMGSTVILALFIGAMVLSRTIDYAFYEQEFAKRDLRAFRSIVTKNAYQMGSFLMIFFAIIMMYSEINGTKFTNQMNRGTLPVQLVQIASPSTQLTHRRVLLVDPHPGDVDSYYSGFLANYYFFTNHGVGQENFMESPAQFKQNVQRYQYIAIPEYHHTFTVMMRKTYHQEIRTGWFKVTPTGLVPQKS
ncbi:ABC transporter permease [Levilactobacillus namurensis]|uniref:ABC transporter permease n=1 Tax=Levilactobacillus namurensis TaxID=380393 RepID=UPI001DF4E019|nr:ABC transporter permease [Levilactobacillus namurensis]HJE45588.1 ABC transporter permease [Levilactobacillus namurensis]